MELNQQQQPQGVLRHSNFFSLPLIVAAVVKAKIARASSTTITRGGSLLFFSIAVVVVGGGASSLAIVLVKNNDRLSSIPYPCLQKPLKSGAHFQGSSSWPENIRSPTSWDIKPYHFHLIHS